MRVVPDDDGPTPREPRPPGEIISLVLLVVGAVAIAVVFVIVGRALG
jgi:hypothetical protein